MSILSNALAKNLRQVTKEFTQAKQRVRDRPLSQRDVAWLRAEQKRKEKATIKEAAWRVMPQAYALVSDDGSLPANARQIMYAARPLVLEMTGGKCWQRSEYFTQHMLPDYVAEHPRETADWDVVFDARGHFHEPHTDYQFALGTLEVRAYIESWGRRIDDKLEEMVIKAQWPTYGPVNRYKFALFIEKEGFGPLIERSQIRNRYDIGVFSTKGMSVTSARQLVEALSMRDVTILVAHDFDLAGLTICHTLGHDTRRFQFEVEPELIELGLRLRDVNSMRLQSELVQIKQKKDPRDKFYENEYDVTDEELNFLVHKPERGPYGEFSHWSGQRVELNAMTSRQFIAWLEQKFDEHGVEKVIPDEATLVAAWQRGVRIAEANRTLAVILEGINRK
jgi:hypothetical protein